MNHVAKAIQCAPRSRVLSGAAEPNLTDAGLSHHGIETLDKALDIDSFSIGRERAAACIGEISLVELRIATCEVSGAGG